MTSSRWERLFTGGSDARTVVGGSGHSQEVLVHEQ